MSGYRLQSGRELSERVEVPENEPRLLANWHGIQERRAQRRARNVASGVVAVLAISVALCIAYLGGFAAASDARSLATHTRKRVLTDPTALRLADSSRSLAGMLAGDDEVELSDGSRIVKDHRARLALVRNDGRDFALKLEGGRAHFSVTPGGPRRWVIDAGKTRVEVVGTVFEVVRDGDAVSVSVTRGLVVVRNAELADGVISLAAGDRVELGGARTEVAVIPARTTLAKPVHATATARSPMPAPAIRASELLRDADAARRAGDLDRALVLLAEVGQQDGPEAGLALLSRGRLLIEAGRTEEGAADIRHSMRRGLPSALRGAALQSLERAQRSNP